MNVGSAFRTAPPGHRFRLYFSGWTPQWKLDEKRKKEAVQDTALDESGWPHVAEDFARRQRALAEAAPDSLVIEATATAPFITGLGSEHPLENGFAFLDPYGIPYLPGSSVKGVVRRATEELALFDPSSALTVLDLLWLFGFDASSGFVKHREDSRVAFLSEERQRWHQAYLDACDRADPGEAREWLRASADTRLWNEWKDNSVELLRSLAADAGSQKHSRDAARSLHLRGSLEFWDALPRPTERGLRVDILNPHHHEYYKGKEPPGDFRSPKPIFFLAVPPGARFTFVVRLAPVSALPARFSAEWRGRIAAAFEHAFTWLGFGAKTALGYGLMRMQGRRATARPSMEGASRGGAERPGPSPPPADPAHAEFESRMVGLRALPPARAAGQIADYVRWWLTLKDEDRRRAAARAIVSKFERKWLKQKAVASDDWKRICELGEL